MKNAKRFYGSVKNAAAVVGVLALGLGSQLAHAAVDIAAETTAAKTDIATAGALIIGVVVAIAVIAWIRKVVH